MRLRSLLRTLLPGEAVSLEASDPLSTTPVLLPLSGLAALLEQAGLRTDTDFAFVETELLARAVRALWQADAAQLLYDKTRGESRRERDQVGPGVEPEAEPTSTQATVATAPQNPETEAQAGEPALPEREEGDVAITLSAVSLPSLVSLLFSLQAQTLELLAVMCENGSEIIARERQWSDDAVPSMVESSAERQEERSRTRDLGTPSLPRGLFELCGTSPPGSRGFVGLCSPGRVLEIAGVRGVGRRMVSHRSLARSPSQYTN